LGNLNIDTAVKDFEEKLKRLQELNDPIKEIDYYFSVGNSHILKGEEEWRNIKGLLRSDYKFPRLRLLYCGKRDGMTCKDLQVRCCNKGPVLIIGKKRSNGELFGAYCS